MCVTLLSSVEENKYQHWDVGVETIHLVWFFETIF